MTYPCFFPDEWQSKKTDTIPYDIPEKLLKYQLAALKDTLSHGKANSRFYRNQLQDVRIREIRNVDDFRNLPFTFPTQIRKNAFEFLSVSQDEISRVITLETSGTTASPKRFFFTARDLERTIEYFALILSQMVQANEKALVLLPGKTPGSAGDLLKKAMASIRAQGIIHGIITDLNKTIDTFKIYSPSIIIGLPVQVLAFGEFLKEKKIQTSFVRNIILTSDYASALLKKRVSRIFTCRVFDHYGMTETGLGGGIDCLAHKGYHLRETDLFFEIIDPETGKHLPSGQWGEVTITTLKRRGMPLIRYRTGDMSKFINDPCPCKNPFKRMAYIRRCYPGTITLPCGQSFCMSDLDDLIFEIPWILDFDARLVSGLTTTHLDMKLKTIDYSRIKKIEIKKILCNSINFKRAFEEKSLTMGQVSLEKFKFTNTYIGKRKIHDDTKPI